MGIVATMNVIGGRVNNVWSDLEELRTTDRAELRMTEDEHSDFLETIREAQNALDNVSSAMDDVELNKFG